MEEIDLPSLWSLVRSPRLRVGGLGRQLAGLLCRTFETIAGAVAVAQGDDSNILEFFPSARRPCFYVDRLLISNSGTVASASAHVPSEREGDEVGD